MTKLDRVFKRMIFDKAETKRLVANVMEYIHMMYYERHTPKENAKGMDCENIEPIDELPNDPIPAEGLCSSEPTTKDRDNSGYLVGIAPTHSRLYATAGPFRNASITSR